MNSDNRQSTPNDANNRQFTPDDANKMELWQFISVGFIASVSIIMIVVGVLPIFFFGTALTFAQSVLCMLIMLSGVFILYSVLFNIFRIIERNQRRRYEWESEQSRQSHV